MNSRKVHNCLISIKTLNKCCLKLKIVNGKFLDFQLLNFKLKIVLFFQTILFHFYYFLALCGVQFQFSVIFSIIKSFAFQFYFRNLQFLQGNKPVHGGQKGLFFPRNSGTFEPVV
jgi:hypothetical protein